MGRGEVDNSAQSPKDARRVSRLSPHASVGAGADTHRAMILTTTRPRSRSWPATPRASSRCVAASRISNVLNISAGKVTLTVPRPVPAFPERRPYRPRSPTPAFNIGSLNAATHPIDASLSYVTMVVAPLGRPEFTLDFVDLPEAG